MTGDEAAGNYLYRQSKVLDIILKETYFFNIELLRQAHCAAEAFEQIHCGLCGLRGDDLLKACLSQFHEYISPVYSSFKCT